MTWKCGCGLLLALMLPLWTGLAGEPKPEGKQLVIGVSLPETMYPLFGDMARAARAEADALGVKLDVTDAQFSDTRQEIDLDGLLQRRVDGILVCPFYTGSTAAAIDDSADTGTPVAEVFSAPTSDKILFAVAGDTVAAGRMVAKFVLEKLHGKGAVLLLEGPKGSGDAFREAFERGLEGSNVKVVGGVSLPLTGGSAPDLPTDPALAALLRDHPQFDAVVSMSDVLVFRAIKAMTEVGVDPATKVTVGGGAVPDTRLAIKEGRMSASIDPRTGEQARQALRYLADYLRTKKLPPSRQVLVAPKLVTKEAPEG